MHKQRESTGKIKTGKNTVPTSTCSARRADRRAALPAREKQVQTSAVRSPESPGGVPLNLRDDERCGGGGGDEDPGRACAESEEGQKQAGVSLKEAPGGGGKRRDWGPSRPRLPDRRRG